MDRATVADARRVHPSAVLVKAAPAALGCFPVDMREACP